MASYYYFFYLKMVVSKIFFVYKRTEILKIIFALRKNHCRLILFLYLESAQQACHCLNFEKRFYYKKCDYIESWHAPNFSKIEVLEILGKNWYYIRSLTTSMAKKFWTKAICPGVPVETLEIINPGDEFYTTPKFEHYSRLTFH